MHVVQYVCYRAFTPYKIVPHASLPYPVCRSHSSRSPCREITYIVRTHACACRLRECQCVRVCPRVPACIRVGPRVFGCVRKGSHVYPPYVFACVNKLLRMFKCVSKCPLAS